MNITINTDASFHPIHKVGGYAFWITCDKGRIKMAGTLKSALSSQDCELKALANAVYTLDKSEFNDGSIDMIYINSDCLYMFSHIGNGKSTKNVIGRFIACTLSRILKNNPTTKTSLIGKKRYELRHVKAHTCDLTEKRSWVNAWCDKESKKCMRESVNLLFNR